MNRLTCVALAALLLRAMTAVAAEATPPKATPLEQAAQATFTGRFQGPNVEMRLKPEGGAWTGTIVLMGQTYPVQGALRSGTLEGTFGEGREVWAFSIRGEGDKLSFTTGTAHVTLERADRPLKAGARWTNSLGMVFVPIPETNVLFCIWETRVRDYQEFARATGTKWVVDRKSTQNTLFPAVEVSWNDARAFCEWLTATEPAAGRPAPADQYRLPTDVEWSLAVGLGWEAGQTPEERGADKRDIFPWGNTWPPPHGAGNYKRGEDVDPFRELAPVAQFPANANGLFDLGGNVSEWCEDAFKPGTSSRVIRGAGWDRGSKSDLRSACRDYYGPNTRNEKIGFRVVLAPSGR